MYMYVDEHKATRNTHTHTNLQTVTSDGGLKVL